MVPTTNKQLMAEHHVATGENIDVVAMFPNAFTLLTLLLFGMPTYLIMENALFAAVRYWSSGWVWMTLAIPVVIVLAHVVHSSGGVPNKWAVIGALVFPSMMLLLFANGQMTSAMDRADKLFSVDCDTFEGKRMLQRSWDAAETLFEDCLSTTVAANPDLTVPQLKDHFRIQDCEEYGRAHHEHSRDWDYLQYLEVSHGCTGWCSPGQQLWSRVPHKDDCSTVVSVVYAFKIEEHAKQVCIIMFSTLVITAIGLIIVGPMIRARGFSW